MGHKYTIPVPDFPSPSPREIVEIWRQLHAVCMTADLNAYAWVC